MTKALQAKIDRFNKNHGVGAAMLYRSHPQAEPRRVKTRSEAYDLSGHTAVVMVEGVSGCVAIAALTPADTF